MTRFFGGVAGAGVVVAGVEGAVRSGAGAAGRGRGTSLISSAIVAAASRRYSPNAAATEITIAATIKGHWLFMLARLRLTRPTLTSYSKTLDPSRRGRNCNIYFLDAGHAEERSGRLQPFGVPDA